MARVLAVHLGLLVLSTLCLAGCQQQPAGIRPATEDQEISTPTVAPSPTVGDRIINGEHYICGPVGHIWFNTALIKLVLAWTPDGARLVFNYLPAEDLSRSAEDVFSYSAIWLVDAAGSQLHMLVDANPGHESQYGHHAEISPDGTQLVFTSCEFVHQYRGDGERSAYNYEIAVVPMQGAESRRLTNNAFLDHYPVWSPDGSSIAFLAAPSYSPRSRWAHEGMTLYTMAVDGSDLQEVAQPGEHGLTLAPPVWSPDGERLLFQMNTSDFSHAVRELHAVKADGTEMTLLAEEVVSVPAWSPDGKRLAVAKIVGEDVGLFTLAADGSDPQLITTIFGRELLDWEHSFGGTIPTVSWSPDGSRILYSCWDGVCTIDLESGEVFGLVEAGGSVWIAPYEAAWSPDGTRVAIYTPGNGRPQLFTVAPDGTDRRDLIRVDDSGNLAPANSPQQTE